MVDLVDGVGRDGRRGINDEIIPGMRPVPALPEPPNGGLRPPSETPPLTEPPTPNDGLAEPAESLPLDPICGLREPRRRVAALAVATMQSTKSAASFMVASFVLSLSNLKELASVYFICLTNE